MTDKRDEQGGLPQDAGNDMSERAGYDDESETGMTDTPVGSSTAGDGNAVPGVDGDRPVMDTGTSFGADPNDDDRQD
ncbi:hypothetical protein HNQ07_002624 [Deinococcus metalli]|uniref:Uncharacterized protein n=1 Tax=Deinococcus metalli TaxID=1141878 RepID=A0A7W8NPT0_9DEIO|nr:hypothetical protein [Deinococcus metalli]MBB5377151.1 hypothetical protein [Deinococcus metalli]GHF48608.1 hypothetical protein GCM10017781_26240 [Deinococcus metalli]